MGTLGIQKSDQYYWLASRLVDDDGFNSALFFNIRSSSGGGRLGDFRLCYIGNAGTLKSSSASYGLRPVFTLKSNVKVTGGAGTTSNPYTLGT